MRGTCMVRSGLDAPRHSSRGRDTHCSRSVRSRISRLPISARPRIRSLPQSRASVRTILAVILVLAGAADGVAQTAAAGATPQTTWTLRDWTRIEMWRFFEPPPGGGKNDYAFFANRLFGGVQHTARAVDLTAALQYVQFGGLPSDAVGPGPLGTGAVYYAHAGRSDSHQVYLRYANVRLKQLIPRTTIQIGRMPYGS